MMLIVIIINYIILQTDILVFERRTPKSRATYAESYKTSQANEKIFSHSKHT